MHTKFTFKRFLPFLFVCVILVCSFFAFTVSSSAADYYSEEFDFLAQLQVKSVAENVGEDIFTPNDYGDINIPAWYVDSIPVSYVTIQFYGNNLYFNNSFGGLDVHSLSFYFQFDVKFEYGWNTNMSVNDTVYSAISQIGVNIGGVDLVTSGGSVRVIDYVVVPNPDTVGGYHVTGAIDILPPSTGWSSLFSTSVTSAPVQIAFRTEKSLSIPAYYEQNDPLLILGGFYGKMNVTYSSDNVYEADFPITPEQQESLNRADEFVNGQGGEDIEEEVELSNHDSPDWLNGYRLSISNRGPTPNPDTCVTNPLPVKDFTEIFVDNVVYNGGIVIFYLDDGSAYILGQYYNDVSLCTITRNGTTMILSDFADNVAYVRLTLLPSIDFDSIYIYGIRIVPGGGDLGGDISSAVDDLESLMPDVGDPFENAPTFQVYIEGAEFFTQFFNYLYNNQMIGAFLSLGLIMCLIVFLMRR